MQSSWGLAGRVSRTDPENLSLEFRLSDVHVEPVGARASPFECLVAAHVTDSSEVRQDEHHTIGLHASDPGGHFERPRLKVGALGNRARRADPEGCVSVDRAPVAQLDRASGLQPEGRGFESLPACHWFLCLRWSSERIRNEGAEPLVPALVCDNYEVLVRLAERSDTIVFGPRALLEGYERAGRLKVMSWPLESPETSPSVIRSKGRHLSPAAERLMALFGG